MSKLSEFLSNPKTTFERGKIARAKRDVLAKRLKHKKGIEEPFGLAAWMVKRGVKVKNGEVKKEFAEQRQMARR